MHDGTAHGIYIRSVLELQSLCSKLGIETRFMYIFKDAIISRARNYLVEEFLETDFTHFLFIDSDIGFRASDVISMIKSNVGVIGAAFPKKTIRWDRIKTAVIKNPSISEHDMEAFGAEFAFSGDNRVNLSSRNEVVEVGTALFMVKRETFAKVKQEYPNLTFKAHSVLAKNKTVTCFFDARLDEETGRYMSEGYWFCKLCRGIGEKIYMYQAAEIEHAGLHFFKGDIKSISKHSDRV